MSALILVGVGPHLRLSGTSLAREKPFRIQWMLQQWPGTFRQVEPGLGNVTRLSSAKLVDRPSAKWLFAAREHKSSSLPAATGRISSLANEQVLQKQTCLLLPAAEVSPSGLATGSPPEGSDCLCLNRMFSVEVAEQV